MSSIRLEQVREGMEDYEYLYLLRDLVPKAKASGADTGQAERALATAGNLVPIPAPEGRYSTKILPNPDMVFEIKQVLASAIERLDRMSNAP